MRTMVSGQDFKRVGLSTLTDILNVVAPPISEHEVIRIWLSHDMQGYEGVETVVYRSMSKVRIPYPLQGYSSQPLARFWNKCKAAI